MARSLDPGFVADPDDARWPSDAGWPYPDDDELAGDLHDPADPDAETDDEILSLQGLGSHLLDGLTDLERAVVAGRFGLDGRPARTMKALQAELGLPRSEIRPILGEALAKVRTHLS
jgi:DNA-directed RNA polymerase sigma subunit (sigma70/sigma32)